MSMRNGTSSALLAASMLAAVLAAGEAAHAQMQGGPGHAPGGGVEEPRHAPAPSRPAPAMQAPPPSRAAPMRPMPAPSHAAPPMQGAAPPVQGRAIGPHTPPAVGPRIMPAPHVPTPQMGAAGGAGGNVAPPQAGAGTTPHGLPPHPGVAPNAVPAQPRAAPPRAAIPDGRHTVPWHGDIGRFQEHDVRVWQSGRWHHGPHGGRHGWWWVVGGAWYFYPAPVYPYPDPYVPGVVDTPPDDTDYWYYCRYWDQYYPYVETCPGGWQAVPAEQ